MHELRLQEIVVFLVAAGIVIPLGKRLRLSPVLGFLIIGLLVGPHGLARFADRYAWLEPALITDVEGVGALAELGVVFLLFMIGLELSFERLWGMRRLVFGLGSAQIGVTALVIGGCAFAFGNTLAAAVVLGACLALSSTAIVMQLLTEQGRFGSTVGRGSFAILLAQDIAVVPILFIVGALGAGDEGGVLLALGRALGTAALAVILILGVGRVVLRPLFRFVSGARSPELFMAATLLIVIATAAITESAGLSAALGAFLAGLLFAETEFRHEIEVDIEP
ncbi:MAG: cation:proton antiporter, partial [Microcella pacifica]